MALPSSRVSPGSPPAWPTFLSCSYLFIVGVRLFLVERFGASVGWGDDIDGTAYHILAPLHRGTLHWSALFAPHNGDHVITATRLWEIFWYTLNGEWDPKLVMIAKVPIFAAAMTILIHLLTRGMQRGRFAAAATLTLLFAFPFNYHNLLWAFQSQFDFFLLTAALGWWAVLSDRPILALAMAAVSPFTLGAGPVLAASYVPYWIVMEFLGRHRGPAGRRESRFESQPAIGGTRSPESVSAPVARPRGSSAPHRQIWRRTAVPCLLAIAIAVAGASLRTPDALPHPETWGDRLATLGKLCAWPFSNLLSAVERLPESSNLIPGRLLNFPSAESSWMLALAGAMHRQPILLVLINLATGLFLLAPIAIVLGLTVRKRIPLATAVGPLALAGFVALMLAATAVARTAEPTIAIRFVDHVMLTGFIAIVCGLIFVTRNRRWWPMFVGWSLVLGAGYVATAGATMSQMVNRQKPQVSLQILQRYYAGDRAALIEPETLKLFIVSEDPRPFMAQLDHPDVRAVMPRAIIAPGTGRGTPAVVASALASLGLLVAGFAAIGAAWVAVRKRPPAFAAAPVVTPA